MRKNKKGEGQTLVISKVIRACKPWWKKGEENEKEEERRRRDLGYQLSDERL
jgi:hypothetical protein